MRYDLPALGMTVLLLGAGLPASRPVSTPELRDLDEITDDDELVSYIIADLDDILDGRDPSEDVDPRQLYLELLFALGDEGDEFDPEESVISLSDLRDEMAEADTSVEDVVLEALGLNQADAGGPSTRLATDIGVGFEATPSLAGGESTAIPRSVGVDRTWRRLFAAIRARR